MVSERLHCCWGCRVHSCFSHLALHRTALVRGSGQVVQRWNLFRTSAPLRAGDGQKDGQRGKLEEIARGQTRGSQSVRWGGVLLALVRARSDRKAGTRPRDHSGGEYGFLGRRRSVGSIKRCQNDVSRRKPGDTEAARAVCDSCCEFAGFLILAVRTPIIPWGGIANDGRSGIETPVQFRPSRDLRFRPMESWGASLQG